MAFKISSKNPFDKHKRLFIKKSSNYSYSIPAIATHIARGNISKHRLKTIDYLDNGNINIKTLARAMHLNHSPDIHSKIMESHTDISNVNLYYGNKEGRFESNGSIMAIVLYCRDIPKNIPTLKGWNVVTGGHKAVFYTEGDNLISGNFSLFRYQKNPTIKRVEVIGAEEILHYAYINIEGVDYWEYLKGNWETMDSVHWNNYRATL